MLSKLDNGKLVISLRKCARCNNYIELMEHAVTDLNLTREKLLQSIVHDPDAKLPLTSFTIMCPTHRRAEAESTFYQFTDDEVQLMADTPLRDIWMTVIE